MKKLFIFTLCIVSQNVIFANCNKIVTGCGGNPPSCQGGRISCVQGKCKVDAERSVMCGKTVKNCAGKW